MASSFQTNSSPHVFDEAKETATMDCLLSHSFFLRISVYQLYIFQVMKYTVVYVLVVALLAALIVLRMSFFICAVSLPKLTLFALQLL